jgi:multidrug efflux pump subunit AcrA (membrane-fusion protein)
VKSLGIATAPIKSAVWLRQVTGYGTVVPLDTIAQSDADYLTAAAAAAQSEAAAQRARSLSTGEEAAVSREVVETAQSKAAADAAALALARRKADAAFGIHAPWHSEAERSQLMNELSSGKTVLVRVTFPLGALPGPAPAKITVTRLGGEGQNWASSRLWEAPADPNLPGRGFFVLVSGSDLAQNEHVFASVPVGQAQSGLWVPGSALVMGDGATWVYLQDGDNHFVRSPVDTGKPLNDGYFVPGGSDLKTGKKVVTEGAGILLSRETNPSTDSGDKD